MDENRFYILASKKLSGELTADECMELDLLFAGNAEYREIYRNLACELVQTVSHPLPDEEKILNNLRSKLVVVDPVFPQPEIEDCVETGGSFWRDYRKTIILSSFVILIVVTGITAFIMNNNAPTKKTAHSENNISTRKGSKSQVILPDGTQVTLNADSKLIYPDNFLGNTREVTLEGEAFFKVTENKLKPFIIHSKAMDIKVLGTVFNVKAYPEESTSEATLVKGSIEVTLTNRTNEKIMLKPSEKITVSNLPEIPKDKLMPITKIAFKPAAEQAPLIAVNHVEIDTKENVYKEIGWTQNKLMFKNESLESIINTMQRWYGRDIEIRSPKLKDLKFTGNFSEESFMQVLQALQLSYNFAFKKENNSIIIY